MRTRRAFVMSSAIAAASLIAVSCGADFDDTLAVGVDPGLATFRQVGCAACHGQDAEGGVGPAMGGHTAEQVVRQVRRPVGTMPLFDTAEVSDSQLEAIVEFVVGLDPVDFGDGHAHTADAGLDPRDVLAGQYWMALTAIRAGDSEEALHHLDDASAIVEGEHLTVMGEVAALVLAGDTDAAASAITEMLAGFAPEPGSIDKLHVQLALQAIADGDAAEALGHLSRVSEGDLHHATHGAAEALETGDLHGAADALEAALAEHGDHTDEGHDMGDMDMTDEDMDHDMDMTDENMDHDMDDGHMDDGHDDAEHDMTETTVHEDDGHDHDG